MEEPTPLKMALEAVDADSAGHWPTVAGILAEEYRRSERENARLRDALEKIAAIGSAGTGVGVQREDAQGSARAESGLDALLGASGLKN